MNSKRIDLIENSDINDHHCRTCLSCMYDIDTIMHITSGIFCALDYRKRYFALAEDSMTFISWVVIKDVVVDTACGIAMKL